MSLVACIAALGSAAVHLFLVKCTVLDFFRLGRKTCWWARRCSRTTRLLRWLQVVVHLLVVQHLVKEVIFEVVSATCSAGRHNICRSRRVNLGALGSQAERTLCLHGIVIFEATRIFGSEWWNLLDATVLLVRAVRQGLLTCLRRLSTAYLIVAADVLGLAVALLQGRIVAAVSLAERLRAARSAHCTADVVHVQLAHDAR